jgi:hypothetical protein
MEVRIKDVLRKAKPTDKEFIVITLKGNLTFRYTTSYENVISNHIILSSDKNDVYYLYHYFQSHIKMFSKIKLTSVIPHTRKSDFDNFIIDILDKSHQVIISKKLKLINEYYNELFELYENKLELEKELLFGINRKLLEMDFGALIPLRDRCNNVSYNNLEVA